MWNIIVALKSELSGSVVKEVNVPETLFACRSIATGWLPSQPAPHCLACAAQFYGLKSMAPGKTKLLGTYQKVAQLLNHYNGSLVMSSNMWNACVHFTETGTIIFVLIIIGSTSHGHKWTECHRF